MGHMSEPSLTPPPEQLLDPSPIFFFVARRSNNFCFFNAGDDGGLTEPE